MNETIIASREGIEIDYEIQDTTNWFQQELSNCIAITVNSIQELIDYKSKEDISMTICTFSHCLIKMMLGGANSTEPQEYVIYNYKDSMELSAWCQIFDQEQTYEDFIDFVKLRENEIIASRYLINQFYRLEKIPSNQSCNKFVPERIKILIPILDESSSLQEMEFEIQTIWPRSSCEGLKVKVTCPKLDTYRQDAISFVSERLLIELSSDGFINLTQ